MTRPSFASTCSTLSVLLILVSPWRQFVLSLSVSRVKFPYGGCIDIYESNTQTAVGRVCVQEGREDALSPEGNLIMGVHLYNDECVVKRFDIIEELSSVRVFGIQSKHNQKDQEEVHKIKMGFSSSSDLWNFPVANLEDGICDNEVSIVVVQGEVARSCYQSLKHDAKAEPGKKEVDVLTLDLPVSCTFTETMQVQQPGQQDDRSHVHQKNIEVDKNVKNPDALSQIDINKNRPCEHFVLHTPKTGGTSLARLLNPLIRGFFASQSNSTSIHRDTTESSPVQRTRLCYILNRRKDPFDKNYRRVLYQPRCLLLSGERAYEDIIKPAPPLHQHSYAMVREARSHVLSQYFHCAESNPGKKHHQGYDFPSLDTWLETWTHLNENGTSPQPQRKWDCYNPINLQSYLLHSSTKEELQSKFDVVGLTTHVFTTACLVLTKLFDQVPEVCNCTNVNKESENASMPRWSRIHVSHGVTHHGDTFQTTPRQLEMLDTLTDVDRVLYDAAVEVFETQVKEVENLFGVRLCGH